MGETQQTTTVSVSIDKFWTITVSGKEWKVPVDQFSLQYDHNADKSLYLEVAIPKRDIDTDALVQLHSLLLSGERAEIFDHEWVVVGATSDQNYSWHSFKSLGPLQEVRP